MLAGILIAVLVVAGLVFGLPWVLQVTHHDRVVEDELTERFSHSMRILHRDVSDYAEQLDAAAVSTPLTRRAQLMELRMQQHGAAKRRAIVMLTLLGIALVLMVLAAVGVVGWWSIVIPGGLLAAFLVVARFSVVVMRRTLDERAAEIRRGFSEDEPTVVIELDAKTSESTEFSVDLSAPTTTGALWDPIPVAPPANYISKPLMPRTVRTIDLSAPVAPTSPLIPTADRPVGAVAPVAVGQDAVRGAAPFRPRAVGE